MSFAFARTPEEIDAMTEEAIERADAIVSGLVASSPRTAAATLLPLDEVGAVLGESFGRGAFMAFVHPDPAVREAGRRAEERLQKWAVDLVFREDLYRAVKEFAETEEAEALGGEQARLLEFTMRDLRKAGHELDPEARREAKRVAARLVELSVAFDKNIADWQDHLTVHAEDLDGLPDDYIARLQPGEIEGTYKVTMAYPDVVPFLENARRRDLRRELAFKFNTRAVDANTPLLEEAVELRRRIAELFGLPSWAHYVMDEQMAKEPDRVSAFYDRLTPPLTDKARAELEVMAKLLEQDTGETTVQPWDWRYYDTQIRRRDYGVDPNEVAAYFPLEQVLDGMLEITGEVFGVDYRILDDQPVWHPDVTAWAIVDRASGEDIATVFMDLFPREGTYSHAAAFPLIGGRLQADGSYRHPVSAIVANLTKPTPERPSLLQHDEVVTLFHEFGHILHQTLTRAELVRFSGSSTEKDFVEAPSQIMEHWCWKPEVLQRFARHHDTGEPIPADLVGRLVAARNLDVGLLKLRQISFGVLDLGLHGPWEELDLNAITRRANAVTLIPFHEGTFFPASFGHMMAGYDAGYYGYLWSEVYGDDMFSRFDEEGVTSHQVGMAYRRAVLEPGGSRDGTDLLLEFLGREPDNSAFLKKLGI